MAIAISVVMLVLGAIFRWGTDAAVAGAELGTVGIVLMVFGAVGVFGAVLDVEHGAPRLPSRRRPKPAKTLRKH